jgi:hypothetical protein
MFFGANQNHYDDLKAQVQPVTMLRSYKPMDSTWAPMEGGLPSLWSIKPDPDILFAGVLDAEINSALATAPAGSLLTCYHENDFYKLQPASVIREIHLYVQALVLDSGTGVKYGSVLTSSLRSASHTITGLDWYGVDIYDTHHDNHPAKHLNAWSETMPPGPRVIGETNTSHPANRPDWFTHAYEWLAANRGIAFLTFWLPTGPLSGPWLPGDAKTIAALNKIAAEAAA